jgi:ATP-dependent Lhr-like helicase
VLEIIERLAGTPVPASALESLVLPARLPGYSPAMLDELTSAGEVVWSGAGALPGGDGWLVLAPADTAQLLLPDPADITMTPLHTAVLEALEHGGGLFFRMLSDRVGSTGALLPNDGELATAVWDLVWSGRLTNDTLAPLRIALGASSRPARSQPTPRTRPGRPARLSMPSRTGPPTVSGRWSLLPAPGGDPTVRAHALATTLLDRHGVLTRGAVAAERVPGGFAAVYPVLRAMEESGQCRRGYFVEGLGAAQFALPGAVDRMRAIAKDMTSERAVVLPAADPAQPYGAALTWPERPGVVPASGHAGGPGNGPAGGPGNGPAGGPGNGPAGGSVGHRPGRKAGALVVLSGGALVLYVERGGKTLLSWSDDPDVLAPAAAALANAVRDGALGRLSVERADGGGVYDSPLANALESAGFRPTPRGLRLRN